MRSARCDAVGERVLLTPFVVTGVRAAQQAGRPAEAATWLERCAGLLDAIPDVAGAALDHARGLVALADGATGVARLALEAAVDGWDRHGRAWEATWARIDLAQCAGPLEPIRRGGDRRGRRPRTAAGRLGSTMLADRAETLLRMAARSRLGRRAVASADHARVRGRPAHRRGLTRTPRSPTRSASPRRPRAATSSTSWPSSGPRAGPRSRPGRATSTPGWRRRVASRWRRLPACNAPRVAALGVTPRAPTRRRTRRRRVMGERSGSGPGTRSTRRRGSGIRPSCAAWRRARRLRRCGKAPMA